MAGATNDFHNGASFYLNPTQEDLLLAALASNNPNPLDMFPAKSDTTNANNANNANSRSMSNSQYQYSVNALDPTFFTSPQQTTPANAFNLGIEESPFIDYLDGDTTFDFDNADNSDLMIGDLPGGTSANNEESNEKRKSPGDDDDGDDEGGGKRRESDDKQAKKPGRKPLTSEPTTVGSPAGHRW